MNALDKLIRDEERRRWLQKHNDIKANTARLVVEPNVRHLVPAAMGTKVRKRFYNNRANTRSFNREVK